MNWPMMNENIATPMRSKKHPTNFSSGVVGEKSPYPIVDKVVMA